MKIIKTILAVAVAAFVNVSLSRADMTAQHDAYVAAGKSIMEQIIAKKVDPASVEKSVRVMTENGVALANAYKAAYPAGGKLLDTVVSNVPEMWKMSFKDLEEQWHDMGFFKGGKVDVGIDVSSEDNEHFTDPIHCIVHPFLVLRAAEGFAKGGSAEDLQTMKEELEEGLEQMEKLLAKLSGK